MDMALLEELTDKYITGAATAADKRQLENLLRDPAHLEAFERLVEQSLHEEKYGNEGDEAVFTRIYAGIEQRIRPAAGVRRMWRYRLAAAAAVLTILIGSAVWLAKKNGPAGPPAVTQVADVLPGSNKAVLTLANGSTVTLDSSARQIAQGNGAIVQKNGKLHYTENGAGAGVINTLTTPRGGQFRLLLPDGTEVWLNAASSIRFPVAFSGGERRVEVSGEAYFEVAQHASAPFKVIVNNMSEVLVLGTSFNIHAYTDERNISTTLLSGKVKVNSGNTGVVLFPGQQAVQTAGRVEVQKDVDTDKVMAWKNGLFNFQDASLEEVMRQLSRWYNIEVVYENGIPDMEFYGKMQRNIPLSGILQMLERADVKYRLENNRLVILTGK